MSYLMGVTHGASRPSQEDGAVSTTGGGVGGDAPVPYLMGVTHGASRPSQEDGAVSTTGGGGRGGTRPCPT